MSVGARPVDASGSGNGDAGSDGAGNDNAGNDGTGARASRGWVGAHGHGRLLGPSGPEPVHRALRTARGTERRNPEGRGCDRVILSVV
jgi:hypothetical protein